MNRRTCLKTLLIAACCPVSLLRGGQEQSYHHLVILGDPHLPGENLADKEQVRETINRWPDVDAVIAVGDLCADFGTEAEYAAARAYFNGLRPPLLPVAGNHDYLYADPPSAHREYLIASPAEQQEKLARFRATFGLTSLFSSRRIGGSLLILLSTDHATHVAGLSEAQLAWLSKELAAHRHLPTIIVFHAPLKGTQYAFKPYISRPHAMAQPVEVIDALIRTNPQIFLWVSGHTHTPPTEESFAAPINRYADQVTNIHNKDMRRGPLWTNSLFLYPDRVEVRSYDHQKQAWDPAFNRCIPLPATGN